MKTYPFVTVDVFTDRRFGGNPLASAAALAVLDTVERDGLRANAEKIGTRIRGGLATALKDISGITEIRGRGLMIGVQLDRPAGDLVGMSLEAGLLLNVTADNVIRLLPALVMNEAEADELVGILAGCGLLIGALRFGWLPAMFVPSGPMATGIANKEKQAVRQLYAQGKVGRAELLESESKSYHSAGTCTFYGTANSNQMMLELMGLHMPGAAFVSPGSELRQELDRAAIHRLAAITASGNDHRPLSACVDEKAVINAAVGLLATGGSTNHAIHIPAFARAAGIVIDWSDMAELSHAVPLLSRVYPNGSGDVNNFHAAGGIGFVIGELLKAGLAHADVLTVAGTDGLNDYAREPWLDDGQLAWRDTGPSGDAEMLRTVADPFQADGGMRLVTGNLGRACFKTSAVTPDRWTIEAPALVFSDQHEVEAAFKAGELERDVIVVVRFQGPRANGMPELHALTPLLGVLQDKGYKVALVTDGRMSGASGKVPAAIHCSPEALGGGPLSLLQSGDMVRLCGNTGTLSTTADLSTRTPAQAPLAASGTGRELFAMFRTLADEAEKGGSAMLAAAGL